MANGETTKPSIFKHPILILVLGSLLSVFLIPFLTSKRDYDQSIRELRAQKVLDMGKSASDFNIEFGLLWSLLPAFHDLHLRLKVSQEEFKVDQKELIRDFKARALVLGKTMWWWYRALRREIDILNLIPETRRAELDVLIEKYHINLNESYGALGPLWQFMSSSEYKSDDQNSNEKVAKLRKEMGDKLGPLNQDRNNIIDAMSHFLTTD